LSRLPATAVSLWCGALKAFARVPHRPRRWSWAAVGLAALIFTALPESSGRGGLGALLARQPGVAARARAHLIASPFGTIHAAMFSLPRPLGTVIPHPPVYALANFDPHEVTASIGSELLGDPLAPLQFPTVNRKDKRDSLISRGREPMPPMPKEVLPDPQSESAVKDDTSTRRIDPYVEYEFAGAANTGSQTSDTNPGDSASARQAHAAEMPTTETGAPEAADAKDAVYFDSEPVADDAPTINSQAQSASTTPSGDPDIKLAALTSSDQDTGKSGESIADKGKVTGVDQRPKSPAERLGLAGKAREKAQKCLTSAIYFEARGESVRGQIAVAQVVMNRVFSSFYPNDVCGVVYQNAHRRYACQFTFACDGIPDVVTEPDAWARAQHIAGDMLDGKLWMPEVAKATHYHAFWVHPDWVNEMTKVYKLGVHTFYRPRAWGDGASEPTWGDAKLTEKEVVEDEQKWPVSYSLEWLRSDEGKDYLRKKARN